jgi:Cytosol aminopeptidase family, N-terminal domain
MRIDRNRVHRVFRVRPRRTAAVGYRRRVPRAMASRSLGILAALLVSAAAAGSDPVAVAPGTSAVWGTIDGVEVEGAVEGPATQKTPLQVACLFEYSEGDIFRSPPALPAALNGMVHLDQALHGNITDLRKSGAFVGRRYETMLLTPPSGAIGAQRLLLIGLGNRSEFTPDAIVGVASVAMREALRLGVDRYAFAGDLKDAGIDSPTALVGGNIVKGSLEAYRAELRLQQLGLTRFERISRITVLAGPAFYETAGQGIREAIASLR